MYKDSKKSLISSIISFALILIIIYVFYLVYSKYNFNEYKKAEYESEISEFTRDSKEVYSKTNSYKINNNNYNDAMFYKEVNVSKNTPYKVTCMIKTQNVETKTKNKDAGANICIANTSEKSTNVVGTSDWTKVEFIFNSKDRQKVQIGFRLGGYEDTVKGTAWFTDMTIESGIAKEDNEWNFLCILFDNINVNIQDENNIQNINLKLTDTDKYDMKLCMQRFKESIQEISLKKIKVNYDIVETDTPITSMSYDEENGFYVSGYDVKDTLDEYIKQGKYDHIFIAFRTGQINIGNSSKTNDWIGLGSMEYRQIGFSNIRLPDDDTNFIYKYDTRINTFPEEVFIHEFLHTLERNSLEYGYERPELHSNETYGYKNKFMIGLKQWYTDYMNCNIKTTNGNIGLNSQIYNKKPAKQSDFEYSHQLNDFKEPQNIIEELNNFFKKVRNMFSKTESTYNTNSIEDN